MTIRHHKIVHPEWLVHWPYSPYPMFSEMLKDTTSSGHVAACLEIIDEKLGLPPGMTMDVQMRILWAGLQWERSGMPIYRLSSSLEHMLLNTELPDQLGDLPRMPHPGFYIACEGFQVWNADTGLHDSEGVYVIQDRMRRGDTSETAEDGLMIISVGKHKPGSLDSLQSESASASELELIRIANEMRAAGVHLRDDALVWGGVLSNCSLEHIKKADTAGYNEGVRLALNFLLLWNSAGHPMRKSKITPVVPQVKKRKRLERQRKSLSPYYVMELRDREQNNRMKTLSKWSGPTHETLVMGHYKTVWKKDPGDAQVIGTRTNAQGTELKAVWQFIEPYISTRKGAKPKKARNYSVKDQA